MSTPYSLPDDPRLPFIGILAWLVPKVGKGPADWHNPDAASDHVEYPYFPIRGLIQLRNLLVEMRNGLPHVQAPALIIHSKQDGSVTPQNAEQILNALGSQDKQILWVENSGHVIPREPDRQIAFQATHDFIQRVLSTTKPI
jgi:esterase/lipase